MTYLLWLASFAFCGFMVIIAPDVWRYFGLDAAAFHFARYLRRKWRQNVARVKEIWRTNWGSNG